MVWLKIFAIMVVYINLQQFVATNIINPKIIIIGAGPSGLATGTKLLEYGFTDLKILEAEPRIGGRIHTIPFGDNVVDLGAQWCHGEKDNIVYKMVEKYELLKHSTGAERNATFVRSNGEVVEQKLVARFIEIFDDIIANKNSELREFNGSLGDFVHENVEACMKLPENQDFDSALVKEVLNSFDRARCSADGCDTLSQVSARLFVDYKECEGDYLLTWKTKGYKAFLEVLLKTHETGQEYGVLQNYIELSKKVKQIQWQRNDGKVLVKTEHDADILADHVIVTVSLGVLKANHKSLFEPALSEIKSKAIDNIAFGTVNKLFLEFEQPFWPSDWSGISFLWLAEDLEELKASQREWLTDIFGVYIVAEQPRLLSGWMDGPHRADIEKLSDEELKNATMYLLKRFLGDSSLKVTEPIGFVRTAWASEPNFRGSYSYLSMDTAATGVKNDDLAEPLFEVGAGNKPLVLFAGEATHSYHYSTVHAAVESGFREAKRLKEFYGGKKDE